jgi:hypothetical protein
MGFNKYKNSFYSLNLLAVFNENSDIFIKHWEAKDIVKKNLKELLRKFI